MSHKNFNFKIYYPHLNRRSYLWNHESQQHNRKAPNIWQRTFSFNKKEWPDEDNIQKMKIEDSNGGAEYSERLRILSGREHPELFLFWLEDYQSKVLKNKGIDYKTKMSILRTLC